MASINITINRDNGTQVTGNATVEDSLLVDITSMLAAVLFDAATAQVSSISTSVTSVPASSSSPSA
jgi:hypothetical protein